MPPHWRHCTPLPVCLYKSSLNWHLVAHPLQSQPTKTLLQCYIEAMNSLDPVNQAVFPSHLSSVLLRYCSPLPPAWVSASLSPDTDTRSRRLRRLRRLVTGAGDIVSVSQ